MYHLKRWDRECWEIALQLPNYTHKYDSKTFRSAISQQNAQGNPPGHPTSSPAVLCKLGFSSSLRIPLSRARYFHKRDSLSPSPACTTVVNSLQLVSSLCVSVSSSSLLEGGWVPRDQVALISFSSSLPPPFPPRFLCPPFSASRDSDFHCFSSNSAIRRQRAKGKRRKSYCTYYNAVRL